MDNETIGFGVTKPVSIWNKELDVDFKAFFKGLTKYALHGLSGQWLSVGSDLVEVISAVGLQAKPAELSWLLIRRSLAKAMAKLTVDALNAHGKKPDDPDGLIERLDLTLEQTEIAIEKEFFDRPAELPIVDAIKAPFAQWLKGFGLTSAQARAVSQRLGSYFTLALNKEWSTSLEYAPIKNAIADTPFAIATERELSWLRNAAFLQRQVDEPMLGEVYGIRHLHIPLRGFYTEKKENDGDIANALLNKTREKERIVVPLQKHLRDWIDVGDRSDAIRVICGGPGSGKTSLAKMLAAQIAEERPDLSVLFIPLHLLDFDGELDTAIGDYVRDVGIVQHNPFDRKVEDRRLLILLDGLDELAMQGKVGQEAAGEFIDQVFRTVERANLRELKVQVIFGGRNIVVEANATKFRREGQVLNLLPYFVATQRRDATDKRLTREDLRDPQLLLQEDQRNTWWRQYSKIIDGDHVTLPKQLSGEDFEDITSQPLLNKLLAMSFERGKINFNHDQSLNEIYADLLEAVYERRWGQGQHPAHDVLDYDDFTRVLEEIALAVWHGKGRTASVVDIHRACEQCGLVDRLQAFKKGAEQGAVSLLTAFYFRHTGRREGSDQTFEFTHKSFGEYLTARRIVRTIGETEKGLAAGKENSALGWDETRALEGWIRHVGPSSIDRDLLKFLSLELALCDTGEVRGWRAMLSNLLTLAMRQGLPMERLQLPTFKAAARQARNSEEALVEVVSACAQVANDCSEIEWPDGTSLNALIGRIRGQRYGEENAIAGISLCRVEAALQILDGVNLAQANLTHANLANAKLAGANLTGANLTGANLSEADLQNISLNYANLTGANLTGAELTGATLIGANLTGAKLSGAELVGATFVGASLRGTDLNHTDLTGANFINADLSEANLASAKSVFSNFYEATLVCADFTGAILRRSMLWGADLRGASFDGADLTDVILINTNRAKASFVDAKLANAITDKSESVVE